MAKCQKCQGPFKIKGKDFKALGPRCLSLIPQYVVCAHTWSMSYVLHQNIMNLFEKTHKSQHLYSLNMAFLVPKYGFFCIAFLELEKYQTTYFCRLTLYFILGIHDWNHTKNTFTERNFTRDKTILHYTFSIVYLNE